MQISMPQVVYTTVLLLFFTTTSIHAVDFHVYPWGDISVPLIKMLNTTFHCNVSSGGDPFWSVNQPPNVWSTQSPQSPRDMIALNQRGITFSSSNTYATITVPGVAENNGTVIYCGALAGYGGNDFSAATPINLKIWGPPLPPNPKLTFHFPYNLEIHWEVPFSHDTIQGYNLQIISESSRGFAVLDKLMFHNEISYNFSLGNQSTMLECHILTINVTATSENLGESTPGMVSGGYPTAPQPFKSEVKIEVKFLSDGTPNAEVTFELPFICNFQTSNYTITIEDISYHGLKVSAITRQSTYTGNNRHISEMFETELQQNKNYTLTIDVVDDSFPLKIVSTSKNFSTIFYPFGITRGMSSEQEIGLYIGSLGGIILLVILASAIVYVVAFVFLKKRKPLRDPPPGETIEPATMYETITEYQYNDYHAVSEAEKKRMLMLQEQHQKQKALQFGREELVDTYQYMSSAAGQAQGVSRTQFIYHPYTTDSSTAMSMNQGADPGLNYPCPAAAGSSSSPVHILPSLPVSTQNVAYAVDPLPVIDEDEYTAMSRAGTLTGQGMASAPQSLGPPTGIALRQGGNVEYRVELQGNIDQSGHSTVMVTEC